MRLTWRGVAALLLMSVLTGLIWGHLMDMYVWAN